MNLSDLVCFGELLWDIYGDGEEKIGGAPFNVAAIASMKGIKTAMITAVGTDEKGKRIRAAAGEMVNLICQTNKHKTGTVRVILSKEKTPIFDIEEDVAYDYIIFDDTIKNICAGAKFLCFGTLAQRCNVSRKTLGKILKVTNAVKIYDFNYRGGINKWESIFKESIKQTDILKVNETELGMLKILYESDQSDEAFINTLIQEYGLHYVFVTRGSKGASLYAEKKVFHRGASKIEVADTTGCGDAFTAGIVYALLNDFDDERILEYAIKLAGKIAGVKGAVPDNVEYLTDI